MERLGPLKSWLSEKTLVKRTTEFIPHMEGSWSKGEEELTAYASGENLYRDPRDATVLDSPPYRVNVSRSLGSGCSRELATLSIYQNRPLTEWLPHYSKSAAYRYWSERLDSLPPTRPDNPNVDRLLCAKAEVLASCLFLGWQEEAHRLTKELYNLYKKKLLSDVTGEFSRPLYHWLLRICFDHFGYEFSGWGQNRRDSVADPYAEGECLGEPVLNELFDHWRDADLTPMKNHLVWLCDYYTHRTRPAIGVEFSNDLLHTRFPATILAWFRLREQLGLTNPEIDHPLMQAPYARLISAQPVYTDELLEAVLARLRREEVPTLGDMPEDIPDQTSQLQSAGFLSRLFGKRGA